MPTSDPYFKLRPPHPTAAEDVCDCPHTPPIKLMTALTSHPLHCSDCNREVAPETLKLNAQLIEHIAAWHSMADALYRLWIDSGEYAAWAAAQLTDITSAVNTRGLELQRQLDPIRRCYLWYFQDQSVEQFVPITACPRCRQPLSAYSQGIFPQLLCEPCHIVMAGA